MWFKPRRPCGTNSQHFATLFPLLASIMDECALHKPPDLDCEGRAHLRMTWVKVDDVGRTDVVSCFTKRREQLGIHTEILESRDDASIVICDYHHRADEAKTLG